MPLKKSKEKKEKEAKAKEKGKEAKKDQKKDAKKAEKSGSKVKGHPPTAQQLAQMQQMSRETRQRASHSEPPPDVTLQMQKVRVLPAIPPECTCGRHDSHQHQQQQHQQQQRQSRSVPAGSGREVRTSSGTMVRHAADGTYATMQQVRRAQQQQQGNSTYSTVQQVRTGTYATVQEVRGSQGAYATVKEALTAGQQAANTYATVQEVHQQAVASSATSAPANATYATVQEARLSQTSADYGTVKTRTSSQSEYYSTVRGQGHGADPLYSTVQRPLPAPDHYATVQEAKSSVTSVTSQKNENYVTMQQPPPRAPLAANTTYASAQQVRAAKNAKQTQQEVTSRGAAAGGGITSSTNQSASENGRSANGNGRGPPTLQPLSQWAEFERRAEEQKSKVAPPGGGGPYHDGSEVGGGSEDDVGALDDLSDGGFQRGGRLRSSLPVVRSPNKTLEKPLGLVFLIYRNETKRALLPNEVTSIDTVRALFVRSFPEQLSMAYFESPKRKVYVLDQSTNVYYELEDLKDIKDRAVLKIYEKDSSPSGVRSPSRSPKTVRGPPYYPAAAAGAAGQEGSGPHSPAQLTGTNRHFADPNAITLDLWDIPLYQAKAASLPAQGTFLYGQEVAQYGSTAAYTASSGGQPLSPSHQLYKIPSNQSSPSRAHPLPQNSPTHRAYVINHDVIYPPPASPSRVTPLATLGMIPNQRHSVAYLPDGSAGFPPDSRLPQSRSYHDYYEGSSRSGSATPTASDQEATNRMDKMEAQLANLAAWVQTAVVQRDGSRPGSARSNASLTSDTSARSKSENATPVRSPSTPPITGLSDISSATPTPQSALTADVQTSIRTLNTRAKELKAELRTLRRLQLANAECMRETLHATFLKIKEVLSTVPGAQDAPVRAARARASSHLQAYQDDNRRVEQDLADLEAAVEDLRSDVLNKRCRVQSGEVESMALALSNVSKALADLKGKYPSLSDEMKSVMAGEMEVVVREEKFLNHLPNKLDTALVRCKKLTRTLYTLKRLASVQEEGRPSTAHPPVALVTQAPDTADKRAVLQNIQAVVPDHQARLNSLQTAESLREMKRRISTNQEAMRFEKSLELAQKQLRETNNMEAAEQRQEKLLNGLIQAELGGEGRGNEPVIPLTDTTKRLSSNVTAGKQGATGNSPTNGKTADSSSRKDQPDGRPMAHAQNGSAVGKQPAGVQSPPQKPPRTMLHQEGAGVKPGAGASSNTNGVSSSNQGKVSSASEGSHYAVSPAITTQPTSAGGNNNNGGPSNGNHGNNNGGGLSSFTTPARPGDSPPHWSHHTPEIGGTGKPPMPPPTCTSTPNNGGNTSTKNVTFSPSVTEISDVSPEKTGRKVPPPPPPRRSSRSSLRVQSPQGTPTRRGVSPPAYENIENFPAKSEGEGVSTSSSAAGGPPPGMVMVSRNNSGDHSGPGAGPRPRPLNKFQQELAEGIYANLNRPDLQNQHVNAVKVLHDPGVKEESKIRLEVAGGSDNESTASSGDSQSGTIRRNPKASLAAKEGGVTMREGKKTPPPPPIRRSSHLSKAPAVEPVKEESERPKSVHEIQQQFIQMEQQHKLQRPPQPTTGTGNGTGNVAGGAAGAGPGGVWQKPTAVNGGVHNKQKMPLPAPPTSSSAAGAATSGASTAGVALKQGHPQQVPAPTTNGDTHSDSDSSLSVQSIVTKFSTTQTLNSQQTSKVVIQRQSVKKCEETEIF